MASKLSLRLHADEEHWIPLSDLMTGLMFLFLLIAIAYMAAVEAQHANPTKVLKTYTQARRDLYSDLRAEFGGQLSGWGGSIDPKTLAVQFSGAGLFATGSAQLEPGFKTVLNDFFPRYLRVISEPKYRAIVSELRVEGYTSTLWRPGASLMESYMGNMTLSQDRARSVLSYVLTLPAAQPEQPWLQQHVSADGFSFSHLVRRRNGSENTDASQRVQFRLQTNANEQIRAALVASAVGPAQTAAPQPIGAPQTVASAMPSYPSWASGIIGRPLATVFPEKSSRCWGYLDGATVKYTGKPSGNKFFGWGYDMTIDKPMGRVVFVDRSGRIVGAGSGGFVRPDVPATLTWIRSMVTGWEGYVGSGARGPLSAWGVMSEQRTACRLNLARAGAGDVW